jgi:Fe-S-cluster containining protein
MILLRRIEAERIAEKTLKPLEGFAEKIDGFEPYVCKMKKNESGKCVFLEDKKCAIYPTRPIICRFYPFKLDVKHGKHTFEYTAECPGIGKGPMLRKGFFESLFAELVKVSSRDSENFMEAI